MAIKSPEGMNDFLPDQALAWNHFQQTAQRVFGTYGYQLVYTPVMELTELFVRGIGEATDVVSKEMFAAYSGGNLKTLLEGGKVRSNSTFSLRPEGTAGVVRAAVEHNLVPQGAAPVKLLYAGPMFRAERVQKGRLRQFHQVGVECLGAEEPTVDAEAIIMLMRFYEEIGIPAQSTTLLINSMGCEACRPAYREAVKAYMDAHADGLCETCRTRAEINPLRAFDCKNEDCAHTMEGAPHITDHLCPACQEHYTAVKAYLDAAGVAYQEDYRLVRGLDYYTRTVFEVQASDGLGSQNAIGGGGRYDKLAEEVGGRPTPGLGFAIGYERCQLVMDAAGVPAPHATGCDVFVATVDPSLRAQAFAVLQQCRNAGVRADMDHQGRSLKSQFKLADKLGARSVVVLGPEEVAAGSVKLRNMETHDEQLVPVDGVVAALS
ncbi:MAG: histidine--tRNA ligase [Coriobacteriia bacterium]|nr:histidine--tRNA ligase [Coriobacteriia bacterium]